jgi:hypothetical protein
MSDYFKLFGLAFILLMSPSLTGCGNSKCEKIRQEVKGLQKQAFLNKQLNGASKKGATMTYNPDKEMVERIYRDELKLPSRIIVNNPYCFDARTVAEAQLLLGD